MHQCWSTMSASIAHTHSIQLRNVTGYGNGNGVDDVTHGHAGEMPGVMPGEYIHLEGELLGPKATQLR